MRGADPRRGAVCGSQTQTNTHSQPHTLHFWPTEEVRGHHDDGFRLMLEQRLLEETSFHSVSFFPLTGCCWPTCSGWTGESRTHGSEG